MTRNNSGFKTMPSRPLQLQMPSTLFHSSTAMSLIRLLPLRRSPRPSRLLPNLQICLGINHNFSCRIEGTHKSTFTDTTTTTKSVARMTRFRFITTRRDMMASSTATARASAPSSATRTFNPCMLTTDPKHHLSMGHRLFQGTTTTPNLTRLPPRIFEVLRLPPTHRLKMITY